MSETILITRPLDAALSVVKEFEGLGFNVLVEPMLSIEAVPCSLPDFSNVDGIIFTSQNAVTHLPEGMVFDKPVFTVGENTADKARKTGFQNVQCVGKNLEELVVFLEEKAGSYVYFQGKNVTMSLSECLKHKTDIRIGNIVNYSAVPALDFSSNILKKITNNEVTYVLFYSRRTAEAFVRLMQKNDCTQAAMSIQALCLADSMLKSLSVLPWKQIHVSAYPDQDHMRLLLKEVHGI